jgi:hypothetical protein
MGQIKRRYTADHHFYRQSKPGKTQEAENQIVTDYEVYDRRPNDADLLIAAVETHHARLGRIPRLVAADAAFYSAKNEAAAKAKGVKRDRRQPHQHRPRHGKAVRPIGLRPRSCVLQTPFRRASLCVAPLVKVHETSILRRKVTSRRSPTRIGANPGQAMRAATATGPECAQLLLSAKGVIDSF